MVKITNREGSTGYYYDLPKIGRTQLSRHYYDQSNPPFIQGDCIPHNIYSHHLQDGGSQFMLGHSLQGLAKFIAPLGNTQLMAVIVLLVLNHFKYNIFGKNKKMSGGFDGYQYVDMAEKVLAPMGRNMLIVVAGLLLLNYFYKNNKKQKLRGGDQDMNTFEKKLIKILREKHKQSGGMILSNLMKIVIPSSMEKFSATALLILLDKLFKQNSNKKIQYGGGNIICLLRQLLMPMGVNKFLTMLGLVSLTTISKNKKIKGGSNCGCPKEKKYLKGGRCDNCGVGDNALEIVGDKALDYSKNLWQFGCKIPEWGYNLSVQGPNGQTKCI